MNCPLYVDFTRECVEYYPHLLPYASFDNCETEQFKDCLIYMTLHSKCNCIYTKKCADIYNKKFPKLLQKMFDEEEIHKSIHEMMVTYCLTENCINCAKFKLLIKGKSPPINLSPDGKKVHITDILIRKKLTIK